MQSHQFDSIYNPSTGFTIKLSEVTDGGSYTCRVQNSPDNEVHEEHFDVQVDCELNKCHSTVVGYSSRVTSTSTHPAITTPFDTVFTPSSGVGSSSNHLNSYDATTIITTMNSVPINDLNSVSNMFSAMPTVPSLTQPRAKRNGNNCTG